MRGVSGKKETRNPDTKKTGEENQGGSSAGDQTAETAGDATGGTNLMWLEPDASMLKAWLKWNGILPLMKQRGAAKYARSLQLTEIVNCDVALSEVAN